MGTLSNFIVDAGESRSWESENEVGELTGMAGSPQDTSQLCLALVCSVVYDLLYMLLDSNQ